MSTAIAVVVAMLVLATLPAGAGAASKGHLSTFGSTAGGLGGQFGGHRGIAVNQSGIGGTAGDVYVVDGSAHRIQQFSATGDFIRTWGWDVITDGTASDPTSVQTFQVCDVAADCKSGVSGGAAGQLAQPMGVAIDQATGYLYVTSNTNRRVDIFTGTGVFVGAFGWGVDTGTGALEACTTTSTCQAALTTPGSEAGRFGALNASGPAIDPTAAPGTVIVPDQANRRVGKYATTFVGSTLQSVTFVKAFGWDVALGAVDEEQEIRVRATSGTFALTFDGQSTPDLAYDASAADVATALNGLSSISTGGGSVTVTGGPGNASGSNPYVVRFSGGPLAGQDVAQVTAANGTTPLAGGIPSPMVSVATRAAGVSAASTGLESCTTASGCQAGTSGNGGGQFLAGGSPTSAAVDSAGRIYVASGPLTAGNCTTATPCRIQRFDAATTSASDFGPAPAVAPATNSGQLTFAGSGTDFPAQSFAAMDIAIDPITDNVLVLRKAGTTTSARVYEYSSAGTLLDTHPNADADPLPVGTRGTSHGLAVGLNRLFAGFAAGASAPVGIHILGPVPDATSTVSAATDVTATTATFNGSVIIPAPGAPTFTTRYHFEYSTNGVVWSSFPEADHVVGDGTAGPQAIANNVTGLSPCTAYAVRVFTTTGNAGVLSTNTITFTTDCPAPRIAETFVGDVTGTEGKLGASIDPEGSATTYHFEWGPTAGYGNRVPAFERHLGNGNTVVTAREQLTDLQPGTAYHYRVVATNAEGTTTGPDTTFETLNDCGLPADRCYELVTPADLGPVALTGKNVNTFYPGFSMQVGVDGDSVAYPVGYGLPGATSGGDSTYRADRRDSGWQSTQLTPPADGPVTTAGSQGDTARVLYLSDDLACGFLVSHQRLAPDAPMETVEAGGLNLFRINPNDSHTTITTEVPANLNVPVSTLQTLDDVRVIGASPDCGRVVFSTYKRYASAGYSSSARQLYEWDHGVLRAVGVVPGAADPVSPAVAGFGDPTDSEKDYLNAVSDDGTRVFFSAVRAASATAGEIGRRALFVRKNGASTVDVSLSETAVANRGATFQDAAEDGSKVFFLANYGLALGSISNGDATSNCTAPGAANIRCDLYVYDVDANDLTNLSATTDPGNTDGAVVVGVLDSSDDGDTVYFAAQGQLIPRRGNTYAQNIAGAGAYNVYRAQDGDLSFVGVVTPSDVVNPGGLLTSPERVATSSAFASWSSRSTPDGDYLLFESDGNVTGYDSGGAVEAYRYSAETNSTICLSCRRDGQPPAAANQPYNQIRSLSSGRSSQVLTYHSVARTISDDGSRVVFWSLDALAPGAVNGQENHYQWHDGQVALLATQPRGTNLNLHDIVVLGVTPDGSSTFFMTEQRLVPQDYDSEWSIYVVRAGGGFDVAISPAQCDPLAAGSCQGGGFDSVSTDTKTLSSSESENAKAEARKTLAVSSLSKKARRKASRTGRLPLVVRASRAGVVRLTARAKLGKRVVRVGRVSKRVKAGKTRVNLRLNSAARKRLRSGKKLWLTVEARQPGARARTRSILLPGVRS